MKIASLEFWIFFLAGLLLAYVGLWAVAFLFGERLIFPHPASSYHNLPGLRKMRVSTAAGPLNIAYLFLPARQTREPWLILYSHGNGEDLGRILPNLQEWPQQGYAVLAYDYPGYGVSEGRATVATTTASLEAMYQYAREELGYPPERIVLYGRSVGSGPSLALAERFPVGAVILEGAFVSAFRVATHYAVLPFDKFPNLERVKQLKVPLLSIHGTHDKVVPFWHGQALFEAAPGQKLHYWIDGGGHSDILQFSPEAYWSVIGGFMQSLTQQGMPGAKE